MFLRSLLREKTRKNHRKRPDVITLSRTSVLLHPVLAQSVFKNCTRALSGRDGGQNRPAGVRCYWASGHLENSRFYFHLLGEGST